MNCPLEAPETAELLLDYCARTLKPESTAVLERHLELCPACRRFAEDQRAVWSALDSWDAPPVSADFDRRLYSRIEEDVPWRERLLRGVRPLFVYHGLPAAAAAGMVLLAGVLLMESPGKPVRAPVMPEAARVEVQPEQVEKALDTMEVLSEFNRKVRPEKAQSNL